MHGTVSPHEPAPARLPSLHHGSTDVADSRRTLYLTPRDRRMLFLPARPESAS